mgnify:CR=1 FL=1
MLSAAQERLRAWRGLMEYVWAELPDGRRVRAQYDTRQMDEDRLSSVQFVKFEVGSEVPVAFGTDLPDPPLDLRAELTELQRAALAADLASSGPPRLAKAMPGRSWRLGVFT